MSANHPLEIVLTPLKAGLVSDANARLQVLVRLRAQDDPAITRTPLSLAIVIDRSGSMSGEKLIAAKECTRELINRMHDDDEVSIVVYDTSVDVVLELMPVRSARVQLAACLSSFQTGGQTALHAGWLKGAEVLAPRSSGTRMCRVMLISDGQANHGETSVDRICAQVSELARSGISTTTVGIGMGFNETLMTEMAIAGQGAALYGDRAEDLAEPFDAEISLLSRLAWRDVTLTIAGGVHHWTMHNDYAQNVDGSWRLPSIAAKSEAWMALSVPMLDAIRMQDRGTERSALKVIVRAKDANGTTHSFNGSLRELPIVSQSSFLDFVADQLVSLRFGEIESADLQRLARAAVSRRDWAEVERMLAELTRRAADNPWLRGTLEVMQTLLAQRDHGRMEKELQYASYSMKSRLTDLDEIGFLGSSQELTKEAFLRRKVNQGRRSDS